MTTLGDTGAFGRAGKAFLVAGLAFSSLLCAQSAQASETPFIKAISASPPPSGARSLCQQYEWACAASRSQNLSRDQEIRLINAVNRRVNASTQSVTDQRQYRQRDIWALPTRRGGDCEDFALKKKRDLIRMGLDPSKLLLATVLDTRRNSHAVLVYRSSQGDMVLDNLTNKIKPWNATRYLFLRMQDPQSPEGWVGIYKKS